ncbi:MAG: hypothetical protein JWO03_1394 [Bacteroidetes bacterium]|nr:hypothetical protein [Bacteroidota bacterium]
MKYRINKNQPPLTDADLASARNFHQVLKGYQAIKIPFYKTGKFFAGGSAMIVASAVTLVLLFGNDNEPAQKTAFITPPVAQANIATDAYTVDADSATEITYTSGSLLHIPAQAFKDADGKLASGKVTIKYREFHDQKDIFLSGIPMTYDSAGKTYVFESAGMMEITAFQNGRQLLANADKPIKVDMVSNTSEDRYNTYYLDTTSKKWINLNLANLDPTQFGKKDISEASDSSSVPVKANKDLRPQGPPATPSDPVVVKYQEEVKKASAAVQAVEKEKPMPIAKAEKGKTKFHIIVDPAEFPEISMYKGVRFQLKDETNFDKSSSKIEWEDVKLKKLTGIDYQVDFTKGSKKMSVVATPVVDDKDLPAAQKMYDQKFAQYQSKLSDRKAAEEKAKQEYEARAKDMDAKMKKAITEQKEKERVYEASLNRTQLVYRTFSVYRFGTYNCDSPVGWPTETSVVASLTSESGEKLDLMCLNLVEKSRNAVFPYQATKGECRDLKYNASKDNMLWAVTADNKLAVVDINSFKAQQTKGGNAQFKFKIVDKDFKSSDEVKKYLEI